ncbi:hypothetical protein ACLOJK_007881 [Asimina triloba]
MPARGKRDPLSSRSNNTGCHGSSRRGFSPLSIGGPALAGGKYGTQRGPVLSRATRLPIPFEMDDADQARANRTVCIGQP